MNRDEFESKFKEGAGAAWANFVDDWKENAVIALVFLAIGYGLRACGL